MAITTDYSISLLEQARRLINANQGRPGRPNPADVRRAVSNAYYALFHSMVDNSLKLILGNSVDPVIKGYFARSFSHSVMKNVCDKVDKGASPDRNRAIIDSLPNAKFSSQIRIISKNFVTLQKARHDADYAINYNYKIRDARIELELAENTIRILDSEMQNNAEELFKFCSLLLLGKSN